MTLLSINGVSKHFKGVRAVNNVSFSMKEGDILGLIGPNGAGKTTLFNLIAGAFPLTSGSVIFQGADVTHTKAHAICAMGMVRTFQIVKPFKDLSTLDNVVIGALLKEKNVEAARSQAMEVLTLLSLDKKAYVDASTLTLPERKRLEVARALATKPKLLLLDEVMAGLRPSEVDEMVEVILKLNRELGLSFIVIEHVMRAVMRLSHHMVVLNNGEKIAEGEPAAVSRDPEVLRCYLGDDQDIAPSHQGVADDMPAQNCLRRES